MASFCIGAAGFLFLTMVAGFWRVLRGPDAGDRLMAAQLFGSTVSAIMLLLAEAQGNPGLRSVALVFASLAVVSVVAFVRLAWTDEPAEEVDGGA